MEDYDVTEDRAYNAPDLFDDADMHRDRLKEELTQ